MEEKIFQIALISSDDSLTLQEKRLFSCVRFVADKTIPVGFYFHDGWVKEHCLEQAGIKVDELSEDQRDYLKSLGYLLKDGNIDMPKMVYMSYHDWNERSSSTKNLPVKTLNNEFILSNSKNVHRAALEMQGINSNTAILCLAAVGLNIILPNVSFDLMAEEEIELIRANLEEERTNYLNAMSGVADDAFGRISSGDMKDIVHWAQNEIFLKVMPKARVLQDNVCKVKNKTLKNAGFSFWKEGVPAIGRGYFEGGVIKASQIAAEEVLKSITDILLKEKEGRNLPEVAYAIGIDKEIRITNQELSR